MYKREMESDDGLMVDPLKAVHVVEVSSFKKMDLTRRLNLGYFR